MWKVFVGGLVCFWFSSVCEREEGEEECFRFGVALVWFG